MKITNSTLRKIIREELEAAINKQGLKVESMEAALEEVVDGAAGPSEEVERLNAIVRTMHNHLKRMGRALEKLDIRGAELDESKLDDRFNAIRNAVADILNALGKRRKDLSIAQREGLPNLAARVVDGEMTVKSAAKKLGASIREAVENETLFNLVKDAGIPMAGVDRNDFFNFLRARELTTADAIESHMGVIASWLKKNR